LKKLLLGIFLLASTSAHSMLWLEPYVGYQLTTDTFTVSNLGSLNGEYKQAATGLRIGGKAGVSMMGLAGGLHYELGTMAEGDLTNPSGTDTAQTDEYDQTNLGAFVTFTMLPMINLTASYYFSVERKVSASTTATDIGDKTKGSGFGIGAGFTGLPFLSVNLEYRILSYDEFEDANGTITALPSSTVSASDANSILLSISAPFDL
jgi:hypothetical protein